MDPTLARAHVALASGYAVKGWAARSRQEFLKAQELERSDIGPISNIAVLESEILGRHDEGLAWARRLLDRPPLTGDTIYHIAWPLLFLRDDATSERWLKEGAARFPSSAAAGSPGRAGLSAWERGRRSYHGRGR